MPSLCVFHPIWVCWGGAGSQGDWGTTCLCSFPASAAQQRKFPKLIFFDTPAIHNDQISYVKHVLAPLDVFFTCITSPDPSRGGGGFLPYARRPPRAPPRSAPLAATQSSRPPGAGSGTQGALCLEHGATSCARYRSLGWGISRCCWAGHEGHTNPSGGPRCPKAPPRVAPGRQVLVPEDRRAGAAALSSWLGRARPASQALPNSGPPASRRCTAPPRTLGTRPSSAPGPDDPRPSKRLAPNLLAHRGGSVNEGPTQGRGDPDPFSPPLGAGGDDGTEPVPTGAVVSSGPTGAPPAPRDSPPLPPQRAAPPPPPLAAEPPASLPDVFGRISAALSSRALPRRRSPPRRQRRP